MRRTGLAFIALALLAGCFTVARVESVERLGVAPIVDGGRYTSGGGLTVAVDLRDSNGMTKVCGVWAMSRQQSVLTKLAEHQVLNSGSVFRGRERIVSGLLFLRQTDPAPSYGGQDAHCFVTDRPWRPENPDTIRIFLPRQAVADERESPLGAHFIYFLPGGPGAGTN